MRTEVYGYISLLWSDSPAMKRVCPEVSMSLLDRGEGSGSVEVSGGGKKKKSPMQAHIPCSWPSPICMILKFRGMELYLLLPLLFHIFDACKMLCKCSLRFIMHHKLSVCSAGDGHWAVLGPGVCASSV